MIRFQEWLRERLQVTVFAGLPFTSGSPWHRLVMLVLEQRQADPAAHAILADLARDSARYARAAGSIEHADALDNLAARLDVSKEA